MVWVETVDQYGRHMIPLEKERPADKVKKETPKEEVVTDDPPKFEEVVKKTRTKKAKA